MTALLAAVLLAASAQSSFTVSVQVVRSGSTMNPPAPPAVTVQGNVRTVNY